MKQSRSTSLLKSAISTAVGFAVAMAANAMVLPLFGFHPNLIENLQITCIYTVISVVRGYLLERAFEAFGWRTRMSAFALAVLAERQRQASQEGYSVEHDDDLKNRELGSAGCAYVRKAGLNLPHPPNEWPWGSDFWKPYSFRRDLVRGCALIIAEGERHDRNRSTKP